jgi:hypothetical protein
MEHPTDGAAFGGPLPRPALSANSVGSKFSDLIGGPPELDTVMEANNQTCS